MTIKGSEDYLVPASEDDMSEVSSPEVMVRMKAEREIGHDTGKE